MPSLKREGVSIFYEERGPADGLPFVLLHGRRGVGQHNHEVLAEIGYAPAEIARLEADGIVGDRPRAALVAR